jgi:hypothetical protein
MLPDSLKITGGLNGYHAALARSSYPGKISEPRILMFKIEKHYTDQNRHSQVPVKSGLIFLVPIWTKPEPPAKNDQFCRSFDPVCSRPDPAILRQEGRLFL